VDGDLPPIRVGYSLEISPHAIASRLLSRLLRALPAQPSREAARRAGWLHEIKHDGFRMLVRRDVIHPH
jgi:ATP-dependent DNA ligase